MKQIKKGVSLSLFRGGDNSPILFRDDIERNIPLIRDLGYDGVDLFVEDEKNDKSKMAASLLEKNGLGVGVVMPAALAGQGLFLSSSDESVRMKAVDRMKGIITYAGSLGAMVSLGLVRGSRENGEAPDAALARFTKSIEEILPHSERHNVMLVIEPINRYEIDTLCSSLEALSYIRTSGLPLYLMLDTFHMNIEDTSIFESFILCRDFVKHIHFLDSNRLAPGMGHLDMKGIYECVQNLGYEGYLCLEALDRPSGVEVAEKGVKFFKSVGL